MSSLMRAILAVLLLTAASRATIFGDVRGIVHDPQHRPIAGAQITLHAQRSDWSRQTVSDDAGEFHFMAVPVGDYQVTIVAAGFQGLQEQLGVRSGTSSVLHFPLEIARVQQSVEVRAGAADAVPESSTTATTINREQIAATPGADRTNSLAMITDYVPGAYVEHNQLHLRGGHGFEWLLDGVPVPNTNISSNVGPQFDPKDIDYLEVQRGGFAAEYGGRSYGVFNVVTRSGFERNREAELVTSYGSQNSTDDQISFGDHTERFAYYASLSGNRTDLGLETPTPTLLHDQQAGGSVFGSLIFNQSPQNQLRLVTAIRGDHYQVPNTPEQQAGGTRDVDNERDAFVNFSWLHTWSANTLITVSPFYHFNRAHYLGGALDPISPEHDRGSNYAGGIVSVAATRGHHDVHIGMQVYGAHDNTLFALHSVTDDIRTRTALWGNIEATFVDDQYKPRDWLTLSGGLRFTRFSGGLTEQVVDPRVGAAVRLPRLKWVLHGFYGRYYQPPPLLSVGGPVLDLAAVQGFGFLPLRGERDRQYDAGLTIPLHGWMAEVGHFQTSAHNFFDHDVLGNSNIFFPLTLERALVRGWEGTLRSPRLPGGATLNIVYSHQTAQARGVVTGGLTDFKSPADGWYFLDHDQRHTASAVANAPLPWRSRVSAVVAYGSGFLDGDGPAHLPSHTTVDLTVGKSIGEKLTVAITALNLANKRYLLDNSNSFGGTHWANPRQIVVQLRYRFRY